MAQNYNHKWDHNSQNIVVSNTRLTHHAENALSGRLAGLITKRDVLDTFEKYAALIARNRQNRQVMLIVKVLDSVIIRDNSQGDLIVACIDPRTMTIKTLMLRNKSQMGRKVE